jgi:phage terminase small subunit
MPPAPASPPPVIRLTDRQEAFCQAMACGTGGAQAARVAGYSPKGAKQRGAFLMDQPEIRVRIDQLRAARRGEHQVLLDEAAGQVETIIIDALENKRSSLALRAIEFRLKLCGAIQDKRITHHYHLDRNHPDEDLEHLDPDPEEELDAFYGAPPVKAVQSPAQPPALSPAQSLAKSKPKLKSEPKPERKIVTLNDDLFRSPPKPPAIASLFASTALTAPVPPLAPAPAPRYQAPASAAA